MMIDFEQFARYSKAGPRYTSYPTAVEFSEKYGEEEYKNSLESLKKDTKLSLYLHLPFCKSACYFCGCNVVYTSKEEKKEGYVEYIKKELELLSKQLDTSLEVVQFHIGGGTPTFFSPHQLEHIIHTVKSYFKNFAKDAEIGIEIDPRHFNSEYMDVLRAQGFNRLSFGVQDFDLSVQESVNRVQSFEEVKNAFDISRASGIESINVDLIYGLPNQTLRSFTDTLELILELNPDRMAVFNYAHVPWMKKTMRKIDETKLPSPKVKLEILQKTIEFFTSNGYAMIGMDHFAKESDELYKALQKGELHRNFQGYTTKAGAVMIGLGVTSIGEGEDFYVQNHRDLALYEKALDKGRLPVFRGIRLNLDDRIRKEVIMELMSNFRLDFASVESKFSIDFASYFAAELAEIKEFEDAGLIKIDKEGIELSQTGVMLIRNIVMPFDAYLKGGNTEKRFSKTV